MGLAAGLNSAFTGLSVAARLTDVISSNVSNAATPGYARRSVEVSAQAYGGVQLSAVRREVDLALLSERRLADAGTAGLDRRASFLESFEAALGLNGDETALTGRISQLDAALITAQGQPDSDAALGDVLRAASGLVSHVQSTAEMVQDARAEADSRIATQVQSLNDGLAAIATANEQIRRLVANGDDASGLMDQRQQMVDDLATIVPLREVARADGQIALFSAGGATLLDGRPARFGFTATAAIDASMTVETGALSGLTMNGAAVALREGDGLMDGGSLAADFAIRDRLAPQAQARLDGFARDLISRLADPGVDPTLASDAPGLFTDGGAAFSEVNETGLAQRLAVNAAVDPAQGGALWHLRSGLGASEAGPVGETGLLAAMQGALTESRTTASGGFSQLGRSLAELGAAFQGLASAESGQAASEASFASARTDALTQSELAQGVDTDQEMQNLLIVEQAYNANARVIQTIDELLQVLLGITS